MSIVSISSGAACLCDMQVIPWKLDLIGIGFFGRTLLCAISTLGDKLRCHVNMCMYLDTHMLMYV